MFSVIRNEFLNDRKIGLCERSYLCYNRKHILYTKNKGKTMSFPFTLSKKEVE